jgi:hypothetical protein
MIKDNMVFFKALRLTGSFVFAILKASKNTREDFVSWEDRMNQEIKDNIVADTPEKAFALLSSVTQDPILTVRDDLFEFSLLLDAVKLRRKQREKSDFRLVDSGALSLVQVEWLAAEGADIYTNDEVGKNVQELESIRYACKKGDTLLAYLHNAVLVNDVAKLTDVIHAAHNSGSNLCLHVERGTESLLLEDLQKAGAFLIFKSALIDYRSPLKPLEEKARKQKLDTSAYYLYPVFL